MLQMIKHLIQPVGQTKDTAIAPIATEIYPITPSPNWKLSKNTIGCLYPVDKGYQTLHKLRTYPDIKMPPDDILRYNKAYTAPELWSNICYILWPTLLFISGFVCMFFSCIRYILVSQ